MTNTTTPAPFPTTDAYLAADKAGKAAIRTAVAKARDAAVRAMDLDTARAAMTALDGYVTPSAASAPSMSDFDRWSRRVAVAAYVFASVTSAAIEADFDPTDIGADDVHADDIDRADKAAASIVTMHGPRRDVGAFIVAALTTLGAGRHTVADIIGTDRDAAPSSGAVAARLFPKVTVDGVVTYPADDTHPARTVSLA